MAYLITEPLYLDVMKLIVIMVAYAQHMSHNRFYVLFQGYIGEIRAVVPEYLRLFPELLEEEGKERMDQLLQP